MGWVGTHEHCLMRMFTGGVDPVIEKRSVSGQQPRVEREHLIVSACGRTL